MKQFRRFLRALLLIGMAIAIYSSAVGETAPEKINWGGAEPAAGSWARTADAMEFSYPMDAARDEPTILLRSAWQKYQVLVDGNVVYTASSERNGAFHLFRLPLLQFTIGVLPEKRRMLEILQAFYSGLLLLLMANFIFSLPYLNVLVMAEHLLMAVTIALILYHGFREMRRGKNKALGRVMAGYVLFAVCSVLAITIYYLDSSLPYSPVYMLGVFGFILLLAETAGQRVLEQINENANMAVYAKLAYRDVLTGLGNRAAFVRETQETKQSAAPFGYIMVDVNDLKKVNDTLGHPKGDALIHRVAQCLQRAAAEKGNCYRIGGDEFVVSLNESREALLACADRIREEIAAADAGSEFPVSAALGLAWSEDQPDPIPAQVFRQADDAMYADKKRMKASREA